jgi:c-di-GMP-binding flagellar brake protein YcgR
MANEIVYIKVREIIQHSNKRKYFRGPAGRLSIFCCQKKNKKDNTEDLEVFQAGGINISCGGMLLIIDRPLVKEEILALDIQTPEPVRKVISCHGMVIRIKKLQDSYVVALKFTDMDTAMCDDIMAFCFAEQRRMLKEMVIPNQQ